MSNEYREYQVVVGIAGVVFLKSYYRPASKDNADRWFRSVVEALKGVQGVNMALYSREILEDEKLEQKFEGEA